MGEPLPALLSGSKVSSFSTLSLSPKLSLAPTCVSVDEPTLRVCVSYLTEIKNVIRR